MQILQVLRFSEQLRHIISINYKCVVVQNYKVTAQQLRNFNFLKKIYQGTATKIEVNPCICKCAHSPTPSCITYIAS